MVGLHRFGVMLWVAFALYGMDIASGMLWIGRSLGTATKHGYMVTLAS